MMFVIGPLFSGKKAFAMAQLGCTKETLADNGVWDAQNLVDANMTEENLTALADRLAKHKVVIATEIGSGVVPIEEKERVRRELAGRLCCLLAERAETVVRVFCGIPLVLKGSL